MEPKNNIESADQRKEKLRREISTQLQNLRECAYPVYRCSQVAVAGYYFCLNHICLDPTAPYRPCNYIYANGYKCFTPVKLEDQTNPYSHMIFCDAHIWELRTRTFARMESMVPNYTIASPEPLKEEVKETKDLTETSIETSENAPVTSENEKPKEVKKETNRNSDVKIIDDYSKVIQEDHSEPESIDSENEDPLKHANIFTHEEVVRISKEKLTKLRSLYNQEFTYLANELKAKRMKYVKELDEENAQSQDMKSQTSAMPTEMKLRKTLEIMSYYHNARGTEGWAHKKRKDKEAELYDQPAIPPNPVYCCIYSEEDVQCDAVPVPLSDYCREHILYDPNQVLFNTCSSTCTQPLEKFKNGCQLHEKAADTESSENSELSESDDKTSNTDPNSIGPSDHTYCANLEDAELYDDETDDMDTEESDSEDDKIPTTDNNDFSTADNNGFSTADNDGFSSTENNDFSTTEYNGFSTTDNNGFSPTYYNGFCDNGVYKSATYDNNFFENNVVLDLSKHSTCEEEEDEDEEINVVDID